MTLLDLDLIKEQPWYDEWWLMHGTFRVFCDSMYRTEQEANEKLAELQPRFPDTKMWIQHVHIEDGQTPFYEHLRPCGWFMMPIDRKDWIK